MAQKRESIRKSMFPAIAGGFCDHTWKYDYPGSWSCTFDTGKIKIILHKKRILTTFIWQKSGNVQKNNRIVQSIPSPTSYVCIY
jgi:hypothetical protein